MNPWNIIGWTIIGVLALYIFAIIAIVAYTKLIVYIAHARTRNTPIAVGQVWLQDGKKLYVESEHSNGVFGISTAPKCSSSTHASWGETAKDWEERVRNRKLILIEAAKPSLRTVDVAAEGSPARSDS